MVGTCCGSVCKIETPHAGAIALTPSMHDFDASRVSDSDILFGEDNGTSRIAEYSHDGEIVCKCRHDGTGGSTWGQMW